VEISDDVPKKGGQFELARLVGKLFENHFSSNKKNSLLLYMTKLWLGWGLDWFLPKGSYQKVPTETFLQKKFR
jgi:hypothetical protein